MRADQMYVALCQNQPPQRVVNSRYIIFFHEIFAQRTRHQSEEIEKK